MYKWLSHHAHYLAAIVCLAFVFAFGAANLTSHPVRHADINSWKHIGITEGSPVWSISQTLSSVAERSSDHAPLYFVLLNFWARLTGKDLATMRLLPLFFAMLALAFTFRLALSTGGKGVALDATVMTAGLAYFLYYSLEIRMYSLLIMLTALVAWAYWRVCISTARDRWIHWAALFLGSAAIINVHYFGFLVLASIASYHLLFAPKDRAWLQVPLTMLAAFVFFLPWLPVALYSLGARSIPDSDVLPFFEALPAILSPYSNGLLLPWLLVGAVLVSRFKGLDASQRYIAAIAFILLGMILVANEFADLIIARRLRYTVVLMLIWQCALAHGLALIRSWRLLRVPALALWIIAGWLYSDSHDILLYTNRLADGQEQMPPFHHLYYEPDIHVRPRDFLVSVHADTPLIPVRFDFYAGKHPLAFALIHMWTNEAGELETQFNDLRYPDLQSIVDWDFPIWLIYNPAQTDFENMPVYADVVSPNLQHCKRYVDSAESRVDLYLARGVICELFTAEQRLEVLYEGGSHLENIAWKVSANELGLSFLWANTVEQKYAFSVQIFDHNGATGVQIDDVIHGWPVQNFSVDLSSLAPGNYAAKLIVYDFKTGLSQPGVVVESGKRIARELEFARFSIGE